MPPFESIVNFMDSRELSSRAIAIILIPYEESVCAIYVPIPREAPVTIAVFPAKFNL